MEAVIDALSFETDGCFVVCCLQVGIAVKKILYATDDNEDVMNEAQAAMNLDVEDMKENIGTDSGIMV